MSDENIIDENGEGIPLFNCGNCLYANSIPAIGPDGAPLIGQQQLVCMFGPPQMIVMQMPTPAGMQTAIRSQFPAVSPQMMCHQHEIDPDDTDLITGDLMQPSNDN